MIKAESRVVCSSYVGLLIGVYLSRGTANCRIPMAYEASSKNASKARHDIEELICHCRDIRSEDLIRIKIAVSEAVNNAYLYGCRPCLPCHFTIDLFLRPSQIAVFTGHPPNPTNSRWWRKPLEELEKRPVEVTGSFCRPEAITGPGDVSLGAGLGVMLKQSDWHRFKKNGVWLGFYLK